MLLHGAMEIEDSLSEQQIVGASDDYERYVKLGLQIAPNDPSLLFK